jgi:hypothetical protein
MIVQAVVESAQISAGDRRPGRRSDLSGAGARRLDLPARVVTKAGGVGEYDLSRRRRPRAGAGADRLLCRGLCRGVELKTRFAASCRATRAPRPAAPALVQSRGRSVSMTSTCLIRRPNGLGPGCAGACWNSESGTLKSEGNLMADSDAHIGLGAHLQKGDGNSPENFVSILGRQVDLGPRHQARRDRRDGHGFGHLPRIYRRPGRRRHDLFRRQLAAARRDPESGRRRLYGRVRQNLCDSRGNWRITLPECAGDSRVISSLRASSPARTSLSRWTGDGVLRRDHRLGPAALVILAS